VLLFLASFVYHLLWYGEARERERGREGGRKKTVDRKRSLSHSLFETVTVTHTHTHTHTLFFSGAKESGSLLVTVLQSYSLSLSLSLTVQPTGQSFFSLSLSFLSSSSSLSVSLSISLSLSLLFLLLLLLSLSLSPLPQTIIKTAAFLSLFLSQLQLPSFARPPAAPFLSRRSATRRTFTARPDIPTVTAQRRRRKKERERKRESEETKRPQHMSGAFSLSALIL